MSTIDDLQRLHEAATKGEWVHADEASGNTDWIDSVEGDGVLAQCDVGAMDANDIRHIVALHNAWPAIHRVLVAARALMQCPKCIGPCDDPTVHAEIEQALRALDDKEQRT